MAAPCRSAGIADRFSLIRSPDPLMPARSSSPRSARSRAAQASGADPQGLRLRLQLLAAFLVPLLAVSLWLQSKGFFDRV